MMIRSFLKIAAAVFASTLTLLPAATPAHAQTTRHITMMTVPFSFEFASKHFDAGTYEIRSVVGNIIMLQKTAGRDSGTSLMVMRDGSSRVTDQGKVVFHKYGDAYFLSEVWTAGDSDHMRTPLSKAEKQLRAASAVTSVAKSEQNRGTEIALLTK